MKNCTRLSSQGNYSRVGLLMVFVLVPYAATATSCFLDVVVESTDDPEQFVVDASDIVFLGVPIQMRKELVQNMGSDTVIERQEYVFKVEESIKGELREGSTVVVGSTIGNCSCFTDFELGSKYRVLASIQSDDETPENGERTEKAELRFCSYIKKG
jgi:hypothetical protein